MSIISNTKTKEKIISAESTLNPPHEIHLPPIKPLHNFGGSPL